VIEEHLGAAAKLFPLIMEEACGCLATVGVMNEQVFRLLTQAQALSAQHKCIADVCVSDV
jgi:hypothetical protein